MLRRFAATGAACLLVACSSADDPNPIGEPLPSPSALADARAACTFNAGAGVADTLGLAEAQRAALPIRHVVVMMKENRSFDHMLGMLSTRGQPDAEPLPADFTNPGPKGESVAPFHAGTTCLPHDLGHQWAPMHLEVDRGKMDGFVRMAADSTGTDGHMAMTYYDDADLPFYYWLASTFALNDRHFPSVRSGTFPNRNFLLLATADGVESTGAGYPDPATPTIFGALDGAGVSWGVYSDGSLLSGTLNWDLSHPGTHHFADFVKALDDGTLPQVAFVDGIDNVEDEHPTADVQVGEAWTRNVYDHAVHSPLWPGLAMFYTYDEAGGFFDHVPPPEDACVARPIEKDQTFHELGVRVPFVAISPWARAHTVSHEVQDHTAITRFIETVFGLPALTARDANMTAALDLFDFSGSPALLIPPAAPAAGTGGCAGNLVLTADKPVYAPGDPVTISFKLAPADDPKDRIAVFTYPASGATAPNPHSIVWAYVGGAQTVGAAPASGSVTLDGSKLGDGPWPLPAGGYIAYYLTAGGYDSIASVDFTVH